MQASTSLSQMHIDDRLHYITIVSLANTIQMYWPFVAVTCYVAGLFDVREVYWLGLQVYNQHVCLWHFEDEGPHAIVKFCYIVMR